MIPTNPLFPGWYADPEIHFFAGRYFIYPTTSRRYDQQTSFECWSSPDLLDWHNHGVILDFKGELIPMNKYLSGALAGFAATAPMTAAMFALHKRLPRHEQHALPPEEITWELVTRAGVQKDLSQTQYEIAAWAAHFGFGTGAGLFYGSFAEKVQAPPVLKGAAFGLLVWAISYLGWLPETGILNQPRQQPARPNGLMLVAHLVWGMGLGLLFERSTKR